MVLCASASRKSIPKNMLPMPLLAGWRSSECQKRILSGPKKRRSVLGEGSSSQPYYCCESDMYVRIGTGKLQVTVRTLSLASTSVINNIKRRLLAGEEFSDEELKWPEALQHIKSSVNIEVVGIALHDGMSLPYHPATHKNGENGETSRFCGVQVRCPAEYQLNFTRYNSFTFSRASWGYKRVVSPWPSWLGKRQGWFRVVSIASTRKIQR